MCLFWTSGPGLHGTQPGAPSSKGGMQPLLATGIVIKEAASQCGVQLTSASQLPSDKVAFTEDMLSSAAWSAQNETTLRRQRRVFTQILQELCSGMQPPQEELKMEAVPHQHNLVDINVALVITIMHLFMRQDNMLPARLLQSHNLANTSAASGVPGRFQEEKPPMTRERKRPTQAESHWRFSAGRDKRSSTPELPGGRSDRLGHLDAAAAASNAAPPNGWCPVPAFSISRRQAN